MLARVWSASIVGVDAVKVGVEADVSGGLPKIGLSGYLILRCKKLKKGLGRR